MAGALPPPDPPHAWVIEHRPLDRCFTPSCKVRTRDVHGYAKDIMEDGEPGAYVAQGPSIQKEQFFQRGVILRSGDSFEFDLPEASHASELDVLLSSAQGKTDYDASITFSALSSVALPVAIEEQQIHGHTDAFLAPKPAEMARFERFGRHVRLPLPSRMRRLVRVTITNRGTSKLSVGSPLVMRRVDGRGPRQGIVFVQDAVVFDQAEAFLRGGMRDANADWVKNAVADRGIYFPAGQSSGLGTGHFVIRFFTGAYFSAWGWPAMYGKGFDETLPPRLLGPVARAAEQGFVTAFMGNNFTFLPNVGNVGWDIGYQSELWEHPAGMARFLTQWAADRPHDDAIFVWWNSGTHGPYPPGRKGPPPPQPPLPPSEVKSSAVNGVWRNLLEAADRMKEAYDALRKASPHASRVMYIGSDHSTAASTKLGNQPFRLPASIATGLSHACAGSSEESNTPFAIVFDDPEHRMKKVPSVVPERTSSLSTWRAFEALFGIDLDLPRTSTFSTPALPDSHAPPMWDDRILVSVGTTATLRATLGGTAYALFDSRLNQVPAWKLTPGEQLLLVGGPYRSEGVMNEVLYDNDVDPYEKENIAGRKLDVTVRMRRELSDFLAAHYEDHKHPRHRNKLVFSEPVDIDLFAPRPFTALVDDVPIPSADGRLAHVHAKEVDILEGSDPVGIIEVRGSKGPLVLKCSANGLPLDVLTADRARFNLAVARTNCPLPAGPHDVAGPGEVLFSFEPAAAHPIGPARVLPVGGGGAADNDELLAGMKRWGYVRDIDDKKKH